MAASIATAIATVERPEKIFVITNKLNIIYIHQMKIINIKCTFPTRNVIKINFNALSTLSYNIAFSTENKKNVRRRHNH